MFSGKNHRDIIGYYGYIRYLYIYIYIHHIYNIYNIDVYDIDGKLWRDDDTADRIFLNIDIRKNEDNVYRHSTCIVDYRS